MQHLPFALLALAPLVPAQDAATGIHWEKSFQEAMAASRQTGRPVIAYFTFDT